MAAKVTLEQSFEQLDEIMDHLQQGDLTLEESFRQYEAGMKLIKKCTEAIDKVEKKLEMIENGNREGME